MKQNAIRHLLQSTDFDRPVVVQGWVRNRRGSKSVAFVHLNDGSCLANIQVVVNVEEFAEEIIKKIAVGACLEVEGKLLASQGSEQACEVLAEKLVILGEADPEKYPLQPKAHSLEFLREIAHLRPRTATFGAIFRIRHHLGFAVHQYFHERGFFYWQSPIITASDAEGAGETFRVTTLPLAQMPKNETGAIDFTQDFFGREANLTVSGQLEAELGALGLGLVYTFGPTFRAENSNTTRHLAEFWMIEPEMAFYDAKDNQDLAEDFLKYLIRFVLTHCSEDLAFLEERFQKENSQKKKEEQSEMGLIEKLRFVLENEFVRISYTEAIDILQASPYHKKKKFKFEVKWGIDLQSEHERYLVEKHFRKPVILFDYPKEIKAFYMKQNEDGKTVRAMDILFPGIGEIVGGSQREEVLEKLQARTDALGLTQNLWWYLETRRFGTAPHSGFGLGFERLVQFVTGMGNIRDVIPYPRSPQSADF
ncbi:MAG: asparagine--tRNA ligase [Microscillaceae bacterium]|nr:asparagine--tRNA ligase [Microscillaceae bacterium]